MSIDDFTDLTNAKPSFAPLLTVANWLLSPFGRMAFWSGDYKITDMGDGMCLGTPVGPRRLAISRRVRMTEVPPTTIDQTT